MQAVEVVLAVTALAGMLKLVILNKFKLQNKFVLEWSTCQIENSFIVIWRQETVCLIQMVAARLQISVCLNECILPTVISTL